MLTERLNRKLTGQNSRVSFGKKYDELGRELYITMDDCEYFFMARGLANEYWECYDLG